MSCIESPTKDFMPLSITTKNSITDVSQGLKYTFVWYFTCSSWKLLEWLRCKELKYFLKVSIFTIYFFIQNITYWDYLEVKIFPEVFAKYPRS